MHGPDVIGQYLTRLDAELRAAGTGERRRRRIVAEAADHLAEATADAALAGATDPVGSATAAFGDPRELASGFAGELAVRSALRASGVAFLLVAATCALWAAVTLHPVRDSLPWLSDAADTPLHFVAVQVVFVAGLLTAVRALLQRREAAVRPARLRYIRRGNLLVVVLVAALAATEIPSFAKHASDLRATWTGRGVVAGLVVLCILLLVASVALVLGHRDSGVTPAADGGESEDDAVADLGAFATVLLNDLRRRSPAAGRAVDSCSGAAARVWATLAGRLPLVAPWLDPRGHWWRFCTLAAVALGVLAAAVHAVFDGGPSSWSVHDLVMSAYAGAIFVVLEGGAVIASAALLGRFLGLASDRPSDHMRLLA